jgi:hypothetical protein
MPFITKKSGITPYVKPNEILTILQKETVVNEYKIDVLSASLETLAVEDLKITKNLIVPDITLFYPPNPHIFYENHLLFSNTGNIVSFKTDDGHSFINFDKHRNNVIIYNLECINFFSRCIETDLLSVKKIITSEGNEIGGVFLKNNTITVPDNANIGGHITAKNGNIGGCTFRENKGTFYELSVDILSIKNTLSYSFPEKIGGVTLKNGNISTSNECFLSGITLKDSSIECKQIIIDSNTFSINNDMLNSPLGINTPKNSSNNIGILKITSNNVNIDSELYVNTKISTNLANIKNIFTDYIWTEKRAKLCGSVFESNTFTISCANIGDITLKDNKIQAESIECSSLSVKDKLNIPSLCIKDSLQIGSEIKLSKDIIRAKDYTFLDGTSMKNDFITRNMIVMFHGKNPPKGWVKCDGMFGTPLLLTYNE